MSEVQAAAVPKQPGTGMIAGIIACVLAVLGILFLGFIFVPLAGVVAIFGTVIAIKNRNGAGIGVNVLAWVLTIVGLFTSPALLGIIGLITLGLTLDKPGHHSPSTRETAARQRTEEAAARQRTEEAAARQRTEEAAAQVIVARQLQNMVRIPGGCFMMGSPASEADRRVDERQHRVCVEAYEIGKYEVTQSEWRAVMGSDLSSFQHSDRLPVERVSRGDVDDHLQRLNQRSGKTYRLPTEAEWAYACRGGVEGQRYCGGNDADRVAWYDGNSGRQTHPVGQKAANGFGLYDMSGNVAEWTCSKYDYSYIGGETRCVDKRISGPWVLRGGSWGDQPAGVRSAARHRYSPISRSNTTGFRLAGSL